MSNVSINVDTSQWDRLSNNLRQSIEDFIPRVIQDATPLIQESMADNVPVKTGRLRSSIESEINSNNSVTSTNTGYGLFVDQPTQPHFIRPVIGKFLVFEVGGQTVYAKQVYHPGTKGSFFIRRTIDDVKGWLPTIAKNTFDELMGNS